MIMQGVWPTLLLSIKKKNSSHLKNPALSTRSPVYTPFVLRQSTMDLFHVSNTCIVQFSLDPIVKEDTVLIETLSFFFLWEKVFFFSYIGKSVVLLIWLGFLKFFQIIRNWHSKICYFLIIYVQDFYYLIIDTITKKKLTMEIWTAYEGSSYK